MVDSDRLLAAYAKARCDLLAQCNSTGHWTGELASSPLSTATAISALALVEQHAPTDSSGRFTDEGRERKLSELLLSSIRWLARHQNADGGWGDTDKSLSNIATTMLVRAAFQLTGTPAEHEYLLEAADAYIKRTGGVRALRRRYGRDKTFAAPILANLALAELVPWREVPSLPFELAALPQRFWAKARLPVVSYAIPALVAIGQVKHFFRKPWNPLARFVRDRTLEKALAVLEATQPTSGGYLEAIPLTSFVVMSLAGMGKADHPVAALGTRFLLNSARADGSWPIDVNLATWNTTLAVNALAAGGEDISRLNCLDWLLACQSQTTHPYTGAEAGAWAWTDLAGGVPDADDTAGALIALRRWHQKLLDRPTAAAPAEAPPAARLPAATLPSAATPVDAERIAENSAANGIAYGAALGDANDVASAVPTAGDRERIIIAARRGVGWLLNLQNGDGGWPTFCRGWGRLPFDRSGADLTAHALRAFGAWQETLTATEDAPCAERHLLASRMTGVIDRGFDYLQRVQRTDGSWTPLWFGNQYQGDESNPVYGTARVLLAYSDLGRLDDPCAAKGLDWLVRSQNSDGGWGGCPASAAPAKPLREAPLAPRRSTTAVKSPPPGGVTPSIRAFFQKLKPARGAAAAVAATQCATKGSSVEETALAVEALLCCLWVGGGRKFVCGDAYNAAAARGVDWLVDAVDANRHGETSPIGFYFAKLWYYERLYPLIMTVAALGHAARRRLPRVADAVEVAASTIAESPVGQR